ncbi:hypothetical protein KCU98_g149, partial [Aureobasidium melanogenum]
LTDQECHPLLYQQQIDTDELLERRVGVTNDKWTPKAIRVLAHVVRMPPVSACLIGLYDPSLARCYRTLSGSTRAVHMICASLMNAVPVERCALIAQAIDEQLRLVQRSSTQASSRTSLYCQSLRKRDWQRSSDGGLRCWRLDGRYA